MHHQPEAGGGQRDRDQDDRGTNEIEHGSAEREEAKHAVVVERNDDPEAGAQPSLQPALAGERDAVVLYREIAQIERLPEREKADDQQPVGLARARAEQRGRHAALWRDHRAPTTAAQRKGSADRGAGWGAALAAAGLRSGTTSACASRW